MSWKNKKKTKWIEDEEEKKIFLTLSGTAKGSCFLHWLKNEKNPTFYLK